jgi:hypothetical protein
VTWEAVRESILAVRAAGRLYLFGQAWLGWQLASMKKEHMKSRGGNKSGPLGQFGPTEEAWSEIVERESDLPTRTADRFIQLFEAVQAKCKRLARADKSAPAAENLALFQADNPLSLPPDQRDQVQEIIASLCDGETQAHLMRELGVLPRPNLPPQGPKARPKEPDLTPQQLAFAFFEHPAHVIFETRASSDYSNLLHCLPVTTSEPGQVSLVMLREELAAMLEDIETAIAKQAKPAAKR